MFAFERMAAFRVEEGDSLQPDVQGVKGVDNPTGVYVKWVSFDHAGNCTGVVYEVNDSATDTLLLPGTRCG